MMVNGGCDDDRTPTPMCIRQRQDPEACSPETFVNDTAAFARLSALWMEKEFDMLAKIMRESSAMLAESQQGAEATHESGEEPHSRVQRLLNSPGPQRPYVGTPEGVQRAAMERARSPCEPVSFQDTFMVDAPAATDCETEIPCESEAGVSVLSVDSARLDDEKLLAMIDGVCHGCSARRSPSPCEERAQLENHTNQRQQLALSVLSVDSAKLDDDRLLAMIEGVCTGCPAARSPSPCEQTEKRDDVALTGSPTTATAPKEVGCVVQFPGQATRPRIRPQSAWRAEESRHRKHGIHSEQGADRLFPIDNDQQCLHDSSDTSCTRDNGWDAGLTSPSRPSSMQSPVRDVTPPRQRTSPARGRERMAGNAVDSEADASVCSMFARQQARKKLADDSDPVLVDTIRWACVALRDQIVNDAQSNKEKVAQMGLELQQLQARSVDVNQTHDAFMQKVLVVERSQAEKVAELKALESDLREKVDAATTSCNAVKTKVAAVGPATRKRIAEIEEEISDLSTAQTELSQELEAGSVEHRYLQTQLEIERQKAWRLSAEFTEFFMGKLDGSAPPALTALTESMKAVLAAASAARGAAKAGDDKGDTGAEGSAKPVEEQGNRGAGKAEWEPILKRHSCPMDKEIDDSQETHVDLMKSLSIGKTFPNSASSQTGLTLDAELTACEAALDELQRRRYTHSPAVAFSADCLQLSLRLERLAADALEGGCSRTVPGAMEVFERANAAIERLVCLMESPADAEEEEPAEILASRLALESRIRSLEKLTRQLATEQAANTELQAEISAAADASRTMNARQQAQGVDGVDVAEICIVVADPAAEDQYPSIPASASEAERLIDSMCSAEEQTKQARVEVAELVEMLAHDRADLAPLREAFCQGEIQQEQMEERLATSAAALGALRSEVFREEASLVQEQNECSNQKEALSVETTHLLADLLRHQEEMQAIREKLAETQRSWRCCARRKGLDATATAKDQTTFDTVAALAV